MNDQLRAGLAQRPRLTIRPNTTSHQYLDDARILVEYDYTKEEGARGPESCLAGPGCPACVTVTALLINGEWVDADYFAADTLAMLAQKIGEEVAEQN